MLHKIVIVLFLLISILFTLVAIIDIGKLFIDYKKTGQINEFNINIEIAVTSVLWSAFYILNQLPSF